MSQSSASAVRTLRTPAVKAVPRPTPVVAPAPVAVPPPSLEPREIDVVGPRKLVRPTLPEGALRDRRFARRDQPALTWHMSAPSSQAPSSQESSHAESFYFQKQMQSQTPMVFVLEDGEKVEGCIEWYDRNAIKVRCSGPRGSASRMLVYKSSIKYLFKAGENQL